MKKIKIGLIILGSIALVGLVAAGVVMAKNDSDNGKEKARVIADTTGIIDKVNFKMKGCKIIHELSDATALECPADIVSKLKVREDPVLQVMDMGANVQINADDVWALGYTGTGVTVAVLDTGIDTDHPELVSSIAGGKGFGYATYEDDHGHGTHVSGIITADGVGGTPFGFAKGAAPDAGVWMAKVCNASGNCYTSDIAAAIEYVANGPDGIIGNGDEPAKIISISLGGGGTSGANCDGDYLASKVNWAVDNGVTVVVAAGNTAGIVSSPGCASKAIAVGAVDKSDVRASFSGTGYALDIMAPGVSIYSSLPGNTYASWSGTSMATPHISATVALLKQENPALTDAQIKDALYKTAKDLGATGWDDTYGYGLVDAAAALTYVPGSPVANAGPNQTVSDGDGNGVESVTLDGSASYDSDGTIVSYEWTEGTTILGTTAIITYDFTVGIHTVTLTVTDNAGLTGSDTAVITISEKPTTVKCWSKTNLYLYQAPEQAKKFCKCASGTYGYKSYKSNQSTKTVWKYNDPTNTENWLVTSTSSKKPVYSVTCSNGKAYPTNVDYTYPK